MNRKIGFLFFLVLACFLLTSQVWADTKKIEGTTNVEDAYLAKDMPNYGYGGSTDLTVNVGAGVFVDHTLIRAKNVASELGAGATNITAVCSLYCRLHYDDDSIYAYRVFKPWVEGILYADNCTGTNKGATWNDWDCTEKEWGAAGCANASDAGSDNNGDGTGYDRKSTAEGLAVSVTTVNTWYSWSISTELATGWYNGTIAENGIILIGTSGDDANVFYSTESGTNPPFFVFTYTLGDGDADTLRPVGDRGFTEWTVYPSGNRWDAFDDTTANEDVNYVYSTTLYDDEGWYHSDWNGSGTIDSVKYVVRARQTSAGDTNKLQLKRLYYAELIWSLCGGYDSIEITDSYANYSITWVNDPCTDIAWTQSGLNSTSRAWAFGTLTPATASDTLHVDVSADAWMSEYDATSWSAGHDEDTCNSFAVQTDIRVGVWASGGDKWYFRRIPTIFNTSGLPDVCTIDSAYYYVYNEGFIDSVSPDEPTIHIVEGDFGGSLDDGDFEYGVGFGTVSGGSKNFSGESIDAWHRILFNATGLGWISKTGNTEIGLIEHYDLNDDSSGADGGNRAIQIRGNSGNVAYLKLYYTYTSAFENRVTQSFVVVYSQEAEAGQVIIIH